MEELYKSLYHLMVNAAESAINAIDEQNFGAAKSILIAAEQSAEAMYLDAEE